MGRLRLQGQEMARGKRKQKTSPFDLINPWERYRTGRLDGTVGTGEVKHKRVVLQILPNQGLPVDAPLDEEMLTTLHRYLEMVGGDITIEQAAEMMNNPVWILQYIKDCLADGKD